METFGVLPPAPPDLGIDLQGMYPMEGGIPNATVRRLAQRWPPACLAPC